MKKYFGFILILALSFFGFHSNVSALEVGAPAPEFSLTDTNGKTQSLSDYKGKTVVLEWMNHECPFVQKHYNSGNMQGLQKDYTAKDIIWLSINSSATDKEGYTDAAQADKLSKEKGANPTALLLDPDGKVGKMYGAKTTPHMFIIDSQGLLVYQGAIDDVPSADPEDIPTSINFVQKALDEILSGKPVSVASTKSYGCSVKY